MGKRSSSKGTRRTGAWIKKGRACKSDAWIKALLTTMVREYHHENLNPITTKGPHIMSSKTASWVNTQLVKF